MRSEKRRNRVENRSSRAETEVDCNPFVFIVGCPRSGTTLLQRMVDAHRGLAILPTETHWISQFFKKRTGLTDEDLVTPELIAKLSEIPRFPQFKVDLGEIEKTIAGGKRITYAAFVSRFFDLFGEGQGTRLVGDKSPNYVRDIPLMNALWPKARFVHLIRDGRDVGLSFKSWNRSAKTVGRIATWSEDPIVTAALYWAWNVELGLEGGRPLAPDLYYEIRYEDLIADPEAQCAMLCDFLGLPYDEAMVRYHEGRTRTSPGLSAKKAWLPPTSGLRDWRSEMPPHDIERFEAAAGDTLDKLGYPRGVPRPSLRAREHGTRMRALFNKKPLPKSW